MLCATRHGDEVSAILRRGLDRPPRVFTQASTDARGLAGTVVGRKV